MDAAPSPTPQAPRPLRKASGVVVPHKPKWYQSFAAWLIFASIRLVALTLRYEWKDPSGVSDKKRIGPAIYCVWHNRLALCLIAYWDYANKSRHTPGMAAMVSASKDGGLLAEVLRFFKVEPVRGSTSRRGAQAMVELRHWSRRGYDLAITPDGPRGPRYIVQDGVTSLSQVTGLPIIPVSYNLGWKITVKSWDRFQIPLPFSRCEMHFSAPISVPRDVTDAQREQLRQQLETTLRGISRD